MAGSSDISTMTKDMLRVYALSNHGVTLDMTQRVADLRQQVISLDASRATPVEPPPPPAPSNPDRELSRGNQPPPFARNRLSGKVRPWHPALDMRGQWDPVWPEE